MALRKSFQAGTWLSQQVGWILPPQIDHAPRQCCACKQEQAGFESQYSDAMDPGGEGHDDTRVKDSGLPRH